MKLGERGNSLLGCKAQPFSLPGYYDGRSRTFTLDEFLERGTLLLGTYPFNFPPPSPEVEVQLQNMDWYGYKQQLSVAGVSRAPPSALKDLAEQENLVFPLLSDDGGECCWTREMTIAGDSSDQDATPRAVLLIDRDRTIRYAWTANNAEDESMDSPVTEAIQVFNQL